MPDARWLDREALARHICVRPGAVCRLLKAGRLPPPSYHLGPRNPRWDRTQVDAAFNGGLASTDPTQAIHALAEEIRAAG
jgi:hypothetical protein